ncbi:MAG: hypothetical protein ABSH52_13165 [Terriglobia bacterium]|jgi:hypothetical protein
MPKRTPHGPVDTVLAGLYEAASRPERIPQIKARLSFIFPQIVNGTHRRHLEETLERLEEARGSRRDLDAIVHQLDAWIDREFPLWRGYRNR